MRGAKSVLSPKREQSVGVIAGHRLGVLPEGVSLDRERSARGVVCDMVWLGVSDEAALTEAYRRGFAMKGEKEDIPVTLELVAHWRDRLNSGRIRRLGKPTRDGKTESPLTRVPATPAEEAELKRVAARLGIDPGGHTDRSRVSSGTAARKLRAALGRLAECSTEEEAGDAILELARETQQDPAETAAALLRELAAAPAVRERNLRQTKGRERDEPLSSLLRTVYSGRCQICQDTFVTKRGRAYSEGHHIDPSVGGVPRNLLVLCATCHRKMHHARVEGVDTIWSSRVILINGTRHSVTMHESHR